jgi:hypothetical protein
MKRRFTQTQILGFLREAAAGNPVMDLCWNHCFSRSTFRRWKAKHGTAINAHTGDRGARGRLNGCTGQGQ